MRLFRASHGYSVVSSRGRIGRTKQTRSGRHNSIICMLLLIFERRYPRCVVFFVVPAVCLRLGWISAVSMLVFGGAIRMAFACPKPRSSNACLDVFGFYEWSMINTGVFGPCSNCMTLNYVLRYFRVIYRIMFATRIQATGANSAHGARQ
jgi:hypothetical protein